MFASHAVLTARVSRWDADELGREIVAHAWDLRPEARDRLNPALLGAALDAARSRAGIRVSNRGGAARAPTRSRRSPRRSPRRHSSRSSSRAPSRRRRRRSPSRGPLFRPRSPQRVTTSWHNVSRGNGEDAHGLHDHAGARWSARVFVAVPPTSRPPPLATTTETTETRRRIRTRRSGRFERFEAFRSVSTTTKEKDDETRARGTPRASRVLRGRVVARKGGGGDRDPAGGWCVYAPVAPEPGRLVVFPSHTLHGVLPFEAKEAGSNPASEEAGSLRVSVAFNAGEENVVLPGEAEDEGNDAGLEGFGRDAEKRTAEE